MNLRRLATAVSVGVVLACSSMSAVADDLGHGCTYHGRLAYEGRALEGTCDLRFTLWDAACGGLQIGPSQTFETLEVDKGLFQLVVDFDAGALRDAGLCNVRDDGRRVLAATHRRARARVVDLDAGGGHLTDDELGLHGTIGQADASIMTGPTLTLTGGFLALTPERCPGDTDGDASVDVDDLINVILDWATPGHDHGGDVDGNDLVDVDDLVLVILEWGVCR